MTEKKQTWSDEPETPCADSPDGRHCRCWYDDPEAVCCYELGEGQS